MFQRKIAFYIVLISFLGFQSCKKTDYCKSSSDSLTISFTAPFTYTNEDFLIIDGLKFKHVYSIDSIKMGNYLPKEFTTVIDVEGKKANSKTNSIKIGQVLYNQLKKTGQYNLINGPELLVNGTVAIERKDGKEISYKVPREYLALINNGVCD